MMKQYQKIKQEYPDNIIFFRLGDFYEMFGHDAEVASQELGITLTGRDAGMEKRVPMCGVPHHAADNYIKKLIHKGYKVAICEQTEDPRTAQGIVKREVIRVITPGTPLDCTSSELQMNTYLTAVCSHYQDFGLAVCDMATGEFWVSEYNGLEGIKALQDELLRLEPAEIIVSEDSISPGLGDIKVINNKSLVTVYKKSAFNYKNAIQLLLSHFSTASLDKFGLQGLKAAVCCAGAILSYLEETQKAPPQQIQTVSYYSPQNHLFIDATTFRNLEITKTIRHNEKKGSLLGVIDKTKSALGARMLCHWLEKPLKNKNKLTYRLDAVDTLARSWSERKTLRDCLGSVFDLERLLTRILYHRSNPRELLSLKKTLLVLPEIKTQLSFLQESPYLLDLNNRLDLMNDIVQLLDDSLETDPPLNIKEGGLIKTGFHPEIDRLRTISKNGKDWIALLEREEKEKTGIKSLKIGFNKVFGYYFEVTKANLSLVPDYFQRKQTLANSERYITEELMNLESQVLGAEDKLFSLEEKVFNEILMQIGEAAGRIKETSHILAQLDVLCSLAESAVLNNYVRPMLLESEDRLLEFVDLRHPIVEELLPGNTYVPNDFQTTPDKTFSIITGPNMAGKSTFCRSTALAVIMAQIGSFVPAKHARISLKDRIFARIGASDDLGSGQSTFMVKMNEVANILYHATTNSLVILDEVGRGTSTYDGLSMAWAVSEYLIESIKAQTLFATHYHELTQLSQRFESIQNLTVAVQEKGEEIVFLHKIISGAADKSYGIQVGRLAGLPEKVILRAKEILHQLENEDFSSKKEFLADRVSATNHCSYYEELCQTILGYDLLDMTPRQALDKLFELQEQLKHKNSQERME